MKHHAHLLIVALRRYGSSGLPGGHVLERVKMCCSVFVVGTKLACVFFVVLLPQSWQQQVVIGCGGRQRSAYAPIPEALGGQDLGMEFEFDLGAN